MLFQTRPSCLRRPRGRGDSRPPFRFSALFLALVPCAGSAHALQATTSFGADVKTPWTAPAKDPFVPEASPFAPLRGAPSPDARPGADIEQARPRPLPEELFFDRPGDGRLWVRGASFKASFGPDGATYIPFFGSRAPRNFPIRFHAPVLVLDGVPMMGTALVEPQGATRVGDAFEFARPGMVERYEPALRSIEQLFVLDRWPGPGELNLRVAVETELAVRELPGGSLEFANQYGRVDYSPAVAIDANGVRTELGSYWADGQIEFRLPESLLATVAFPLTIDPVLSNFPIDSSPAITFNPGIAYDATNERFLVTWEIVASGGDRDVFAEFRDFDGQPLGGGAFIDMSADTWIETSVANNNAADNFLVVGAVGPGGSRSIFGRLRSAASTSMGMPFLIDNGSFGDKRAPDVGGDPNLDGPSHYFVVWERIFNATDHDVHGRLVAANGTFPGFLVLLDNTSATLDTDPRISPSVGQGPSVSRNWNIAWSRTASPVDHDVYGAMVSPSGTIYMPSYGLDVSGYDDYLPVPSSPLDDPGTGFRPWLVSCTRTWPFPNVQGTLMVGPYVGPQVSLSAIEQSSNHQPRGYQTGIDSDGRSFQLVYSEQYAMDTWDHDMYAATFEYTSGTLVCTEAHQNLVSIEHIEIDPELCATYSAGGPRQRAAIVWSDVDNNNDYDIEGAIYDARVPDLGSSYCSTTANSSGAHSQIWLTGSPYTADHDLVLHSDGNPNSASGLFFFGSSGIQTTFGNGYRCAGGGTHRIAPVAHTNAAGSVARTLDWNAPYAAHLAPGNVYFQFWFRDAMGGGAQFNLSNGWQGTLLP